MKYNFGLIKNKEIKFVTTIDGKKMSFQGILLNVKNNKNSLEFIFENNKLVVEDLYFRFLLFRKIDGVYTFVFDENNRKISCFVGFSLFDTYGFPMELTEELLMDDGYQLDTEGFQLLRELQKELSRNTFKSKNNVF